MAKKILLTKGKYATVDDVDFDYLSQWKWHYVASHNGYAARREYPSRKYIYMHRQITSADSDMDVDHISNDGLDNRRTNLRVCTTAQNLAYKSKQRGHSNRYKGITRANGQWVAQVQVWVNGVRTSRRISGLSTQAQAAKAYDKLATEYFGDFAKLNFKGRD